VSSDPNRATVVYRFFDRTGRLLYVGITYDPAERWKHHAAKTRWWRDAADNTLEWYGTRAEAERAEQVAIRYEKPLYNKAGSANAYQGPTTKRGMRLPRRVHVADDIWADFEKLCAEEGVTPEEAITAHIAGRIKADRLEKRRYAAQLRRIKAASN
jgi:predicted GIY-YIG superfamily endonuclease